MLVVVSTSSPQRWPTSDTAKNEKKPTWRNTRKCSTTSAYSSTSLPARPSCSLSSHPTTSLAKPRSCVPRLVHGSNHRPLSGKCKRNHSFHIWHHCWLGPLGGCRETNSSGNDVVRKRCHCKVTTYTHQYLGGSALRAGSQRGSISVAMTLARGSREARSHACRPKTQYDKIACRRRDDVPLGRDLPGRCHSEPGKDCLSS